MVQYIIRDDDVEWQPRRVAIIVARRSLPDDNDVLARLLVGHHWYHHNHLLLLDQHGMSATIAAFAREKSVPHSVFGCTKRPASSTISQTYTRVSDPLSATLADAHTLISVQDSDAFSAAQQLHIPAVLYWWCQRQRGFIKADQTL